MDWFQKEVTVKAKERGFFLATDSILSQIPEIQKYEVGMLHLFIKHTSASLTISENSDPTVRRPALNKETVVSRPAIRSLQRS